MTQETKTTATKPTKISFPQKAKTRNKPTIPKLLSTRTPLTTEVTTKRTIKTNFPNRTTTQQTTSKNILSKFLSSAPGTLNSPLPPLSSTAEIVKTSKTTHVVITTVILMVGVVVVEVTIIIVGILVVRRCRQQRNNTRPNKANDRRAVSNVYATSPDEACDENQYKDVSEGVYDTTLKRRSHVNCSSNEYSTGSFYSRMFRGSNNDRRRPIEENLPMS
ncbi:uncharacterized protein LOC133202471 [Saccostrea echinata]|uniref:uncharacterized protein LOC133202471 n=1 Tax=Saccostrea echinata TaxID=191078 RepID=UPI002A8062BB|nr:uncharacterized protein LOC133202471 [Saccostrea echinata]